MIQELQGRVAVVIGGGRGLGEAFCRTLAGAGAIPVVADIREELAQKVALEIQADGGKAMALHLDVRDESQVAAGIAQVTGFMTLSTPRSSTLPLVASNW